MVKAAEKAKRKKGPEWSEEEQRLMWALRDAGAKGSTIATVMNQHYGRTGKNARGVPTYWNAFHRYKAMRTKVTPEDKATAKTLLGEPTVQAAAEPKRRGRKPKLDLATVDPAQLSAGARKALEDKLALQTTVRRFKLETPDASIEVAVSGKGAEVIFKKLVGSITIFGK